MHWSQMAKLRFSFAVGIETVDALGFLVSRFRKILEFVVGVLHIDLMLSDNNGYSRSKWFLSLNQWIIVAFYSSSYRFATF